MPAAPLRNRACPAAAGPEISPSTAGGRAESCPRAFAGRPPPPRSHVCGDVWHGGGHATEPLELRPLRLGPQTRPDGFLPPFLPGDRFLPFGKRSPWAITDTQFASPALKVPPRPQSCLTSGGLPHGQTPVPGAGRACACPFLSEKPPHAHRGCCPNAVVTQRCLALLPSHPLPSCLVGGGKLSVASPALSGSRFYGHLLSALSLITALKFRSFQP